jgi:glycosyltransferase involved in cell wall biosynthesis
VHILIVTQYFWPENFRINDLALGLRDIGHKVTVLTGQPNYPDGQFFRGYGFFKPVREDYDGVAVLRVPLLPRGLGGGLRLALNYFSFAFFATLLAPFRCSGSYDVIFVYEPSPITVGLPALLLKKLKNVPVMFWVQDLWPESLSAAGNVHSPLILKLARLLICSIYHGCDLILTQSRVFSSYIERDGISANMIRYFPNSAEEIYQPVTLESGAPEHAKMPPGFRIVFAGNIGSAQDFGTILRAAELIKTNQEIKWIIIGEGRMRPWVEEQIRERGLTNTVYLLGRYPMEAMPRFFALADALLVTLKREIIFSLTIPGKVQSYMSCARPIIAALDGEGARVVEEAGAGLTCPAENPDALAKTILKMYHMTAAERDSMARQGRIYFEKNFERNMLLNRLDGWLSELSTRGK